MKITSRITQNRRKVKGRKPNLKDPLVQWRLQVAQAWREGKEPPPPPPPKPAKENKTSPQPSPLPPTRVIRIPTPPVIARLRASVQRVWDALVSLYWSAGSRPFHPVAREVAERAGCSRAYVWIAIKILVRAHALERVPDPSPRGERIFLQWKHVSAKSATSPCTPSYKKNIIASDDRPRAGSSRLLNLPLHRAAKAIRVECERLWPQEIPKARQIARGIIVRLWSGRMTLDSARALIQLMREHLPGILHWHEDWDVRRWVSYFRFLEREAVKVIPLWKQQWGERWWEALGLPRFECGGEGGLERRLGASSPCAAGASGKWEINEIKALGAAGVVRELAQSLPSM